MDGADDPDLFKTCTNCYHFKKDHYYTHTKDNDPHPCMKCNCIRFKTMNQ